VRGAQWLLLASSSVAALLIGGGAVPAWATGVCKVTQTSNTPGSVTNSTANGNCILVENASVGGSVVNTSTGVLTPNGSSAPSTTGITINSATVSGRITNQGTITATASGGIGILLENGATVGGGIGIIGGILNASGIGIAIDPTSTVSGGQIATVAVGGYLDGGVITVSTFAGGISNSGTISGSVYGIAVGGIAVGGTETIGTFTGGITNAGNIMRSSRVGIVVGGEPDVRGQVTITSFGGGVTNTGTISAGTAQGIIVGSYQSGGVALIISTFSGNIVNAGTISAGRNGILVGGASAQGSTTIATFNGSIVNSASGIIEGGGGIVVGGGEYYGNSITISTFAGGITNSGTITGGGSISVGGQVYSGGSVTIGTFGGGISNSGTIAGGVIEVAGVVNQGGSFTISTFSGNIVNGGKITAATSSNALFVGGEAFGNGSSVTIGTFAGSIVNSAGGTITSASGHGIFVGGTAAQAGASLTISTFAGRISNAGLITAGLNGIFVGGTAKSGGSLTISTFTGGISNTGTISAGGKGIFVGGGARGAGSSVAISTFSGGITNNGTITAKTGIVIGVQVQNFVNGAIVNSGTITGTVNAIDISAAPNGMTIDVLGGAISGNMTGAGTTSADTVNFTLGAGNTFSYANTIAGMQTVNVNSGTLFDGGAITAGTVTVNAGAVLAPGLPHTTGTLTITGNLVFASAAAYLETISGAASSKTTVTGAATLGGASVQIATGSTVTAGFKYTILTDTAGDLGGTNLFNPTVNFGQAYTATLSYDADDVFLTFKLNSLLPLLPPGTPQNVLNVANAIDNFILGGGTLPAGFSNLFNLSGAQLVSALTQLEGQNATGAQTGAFTLMTEFVDLMLGQSGGGGTLGGGLGFAPDQQTAALPPELALAYDSILKAPAKPQTFDQRWSVWGSGFGGTATFNGNATVGSNNVTASTYGSAAGMEYRVDPHTVYGFALAGSGLNWSLAQNLGTGRSDSFQAGVYAKTYWGPAYLSGAAAFGNNWFTTNRTALGDQLSASFTGQSYALRGEAGYRYAVSMSGAFIGVTPYGALQTQWFHTPAYSETDLTGGGFGLSYNANTTNDTRSELGARFDNLTTWNNKPLVLRSSLAWAHDWVSGTGLNAAFETLPGSAFTVNGAAVPFDSALTTASAQYYFTPDLSFTAKFAGEFAPTSQTYAGSGTLKYTW
jgi:uncharacterized protein with beta-barrel porin domain